jgi:hypothetical protein
MLGIFTNLHRSDRYLLLISERLVESSVERASEMDGHKTFHSCDTAGSGDRNDIIRVQWVIQINILQTLSKIQLQQNYG